MNDYKGREGESVVVRKRIKDKTQHQQQQQQQQHHRQPSPSTARPHQLHRRSVSLPNNQHGFLFLLPTHAFLSFFLSFLSFSPIFHAKPLLSSHIIVSLLKIHSCS